MIENDQWDRDGLATVMGEIAADARRAGQVMRGLLELYRERKGDFLPVDVNTVVAETIPLLRSEMVAHDVELATECAPSVPMVLGDFIQIQQVLANLIMNGIQAMSGVAREDRGTGIDPEVIDRIFEPLATWKPGGTGMGLALSNSIIAGHEGRMWAENLSQGGARVGFAIPVLEQGRQT
jgi:signal transduction histidine kinase